MEKQPKKDIIKRLWCQLISVQDFDKLRLDENGWSDWNCRKYITSNLWDNLSDKLGAQKSKMINGGDLLYRPKSLKGIENNNGWNRIDNNFDLPILSDTYMFLNNGKVITQWYENGVVIPKSFTHWREVIQPQLPLY